MQTAQLVLEDGAQYIGKSFGAVGEVWGEVVFNTCMTGYQEVLTDPSYKGQIVVMTYPLIGNYGFNEESSESAQPQAEGFVVKELCDLPSNWRSAPDSADYFEVRSVVGICDIDTRHLTRHIREKGSMIGIITTRPDPPALLAERARALGAQRRDLVSLVTSAAPRHVPGDGPRIAVLDFGVKENMIRALSRLGCDVHVLPAQTSAEQVLSIAPNGVLLSNGPGDPADIPYALDMIRGLLGKKPLFGICLGHQLLGMALGGRSYKLKFGHHGGNHPVKDLRQNRIYITSQNHNYALAGDPVPGLRITHINLNDQTVEGFVHTELPVMGIQFHPEAAPGPLDAMGLFEDFLSML